MTAPGVQQGWTITVMRAVEVFIPDTRETGARDDVQDWLDGNREPDPTWVVDEAPPGRPPFIAGARLMLTPNEVTA